MIADYEFVNHAAPLPWPTRAMVDGYPWDYDPSQRFFRLATGITEYVQQHRNTSAPNGYLGEGHAVYPFIGLIEQVAYTRAILKDSGVTPGPWSNSSLGIQRAGGIPWQMSQDPIMALGRKSG